MLAFGGGWVSVESNQSAGCMRASGSARSRSTKSLPARCRHLIPQVQTNIGPSALAPSDHRLSAIPKGVDMGRHLEV